MINYPLLFHSIPLNINMRLLSDIYITYRLFVVFID